MPICNQPSATEERKKKIQYLSSRTRYKDAFWAHSHIQTHLNDMNILLLVTAVFASPFIGLPGKNVLEDGFDECK